MSAKIEGAPNSIGGIGGVYWLLILIIGVSRSPKSDVLRLGHTPTAGAPGGPMLRNDALVLWNRAGRLHDTKFARPELQQLRAKPNIEERVGRIGANTSEIRKYAPRAQDVGEHSPSRHLRGCPEIAKITHSANLKGTL